LGAVEIIDLANYIIRFQTLTNVYKRK